MQKLKIGKLEFIVFAAGTAVMVLELIGSRILAPFLGNSIFVWASLIGIILGALSLGYYLGGYFSKTNPRLNFITKILLLTGLSILLITLIKDPVLSLATTLGVRTGSAVATLALFALPSILLGMVSPYVIRLKVENVENSGGVAGNLSALSTIGSIFGTFLAGFYLIPTFGSSQILFGLSLILILTSLLAGKKTFKLFSLLIIILVWIAFQFYPSVYVLETDSPYNHIRVVDTIDDKTDQPIRILFLATEAHSVIYKNSDQIYSEYLKFYSLDNLFKPNITKALTLGGGAYIAPLNFLMRHPTAEMTVVEIDPTVTQVAENYFQLKPDPRLNIIHQDGRIFLNNNQEKFDVIYGDAFTSSLSIPFQLTTKQALEKIHDSLVDDGILILNVISSLSGKKSKFFQAEYLTLQQIFSQIYIFPAHYYDQAGLNKPQNIIIIATKSTKRLSRADLLQKASGEQVELLNRLQPDDIPIEPTTKILTDEFAPVDNYVAELL